MKKPRVSRPWARSQCDALTGLANRSHFMGFLRQATQAEDATGGALFIIRVANLATVDQSLGREATDELVRLRQRARQSGGREATGGRCAPERRHFALLIPSMAPSHKNWPSSCLQT